jgi:hypothetical protein
MRSRVLLSLMALHGAALLPAAEPLSAERLEKLKAVIRPAAEEDRYRQIPWLTDLWEARRQAAVQGKPILLWEMDGHPLGCT